MVDKGNISKNEPRNINAIYYSKDISELFPITSASYFILIEGAPGIGKTVLSKEIACQWAENKLLNFKKLVFLLFLRDPKLQKMVTLENLAQYLCSNNKIGLDLSEYLFKSKGKDLTIIFDGYDEMSEEDRSNSLVADIISRNILPECDLVVTSRPTASLHLRDMADCRVEVLGFTEEDRLDYIQHTLEGSQKKIKILQSYLQSNSTINALCYVPLNMTILLCLYEDISSLQNTALNTESIHEIGLPNSQTEMYEKFILMAITRCIKRSNKNFSDKHLKISEIPEPYNEIFNELLQLAYYALTKDKIVFNSDEEFVQQFCKSLISGNCHGLGLLKVTEHVDIVSFHFLHFSIQEYLAAYYIASQSTSRQYQLLKDTFWDIHYFNTWIMYVGITGGKKLAWKHYISGNWFMLSTKIFKSFKISKKFLNDKIKSLHLFQCFAEIGNKELVKNIFKDKIIDISDQTLLPKDINTICFFLLRSGNKHWIKMDLSNCNIGDIGIDILYKKFIDKSREIVCIDKVDLSHNLLQNQSILGLLDLVKLWHTSELVINMDDYDSNLFKLCLNKFYAYVDEDFSQTVLVGPFLFVHNINHQVAYDQLINSTHITGLYLNLCNYHSADSSFQEIIHQLNLSKLHIISKSLPINFLGAIVQRMTEIDSVYIYDNSLSNEHVNYISSLILHKANSTNSGVWVVIGSTKILGNLQDFLNLSENLLPIEIFNIAKSIRRLCSGSSVSTSNFAQCGNYKNKYYLFEVLLTLLHTNTTQCEITFCMADDGILIANGVKSNVLSQMLSLNDQLIYIYARRCEFNVTELEAIINLVIKQKLLKRLYIVNSSLQTYHFKEICRKLLITTPWLEELLIHSTDSSCILISDLCAVQRSDTAILLINSDTLIGQNPTSRQLSLTLQLEPNITVWKLPNCHINVQTFYQLAIMLSDVSELDISGCSIGECEVQEIKKCSKQKNCFANLTKLNIGNVKISNQAAIDMASMFSHATKLNSLDLHNNNLLIANACKLLNIMNLIKLDISFNTINGKTADIIAEILYRNTKLEELNINSCDLQATDAVTVFKGMKSILHLSKFNISHNGINDEAMEELAEILSQNVKLKELDLSYNFLKAKGAITILRGMKSILHLSKFHIGHNKITDDVADDLVRLLSQNVELKEIDLSCNCLQAEGAISIFKGMKSVFHLSKFNVSHNTITDKAADDLAEILSHNFGLTEIDLSCNCLQATGASTICKGMNGLTNLIKLNISDNNITGEAAHDIAAILSHNKFLEELDLSCNMLGGFGIIQICFSMKDFRSLMKLNVGSIGITDFEADDITAVLNNNIKLKELDLSHNNIQAIGTTQIFQNTTISSLNKLNISHNNITDEAAEDIATFISHNNELEELDICHNSLQAAGVVKIFKVNISKLIKLNISHNNITTIVSNDIATSLSHYNRLQVLDMSYCNLGFIRIFKNMQTLSVLKINNCYIISEAAKELATVLLDSIKLKEIDLSHNDLSTTDTITVFEGMKNMSDLIAIDISHNMITDEAADNIASVLISNTKLKELDVSHNNFSASGAIKIFEGMKNISNMINLNISHNMITDEAADNIATVLSQNNNLLMLDISSNYLRSAGCVKVFGGIKNMAHLTKLDISNTNIAINTVDTDATCLSSELNLVYTNVATKAFNSMENISRLQKINFAHIMTTDVALDELTAFLLQNTELEELDISGNNLQTTGAIHLFQNLKQITTFTKLNIAQNSITDKATESIASVLSNCSEVVELNLSYNSLHNMSTFDYLTGSNMTKINLSNNNIDNQTVSELSVFLSHCTKLEELNLANNNLQTANAIKLFENLTCITLKIINISHNCIAVDAAYNIAKTLSMNYKLQEVDLSCNALKEIGIIEILSSINIANLTKLNISDNNISGRSVMQYILTHAINLVALDFSCNKLYLTNVNHCCSNLIQLNMSCDRITDKQAAALKFILASNSRLQELDISHNNLCTGSISTIFGKLNISLLTKFNASNNVIGEQAADDMGRFLSQNTKLKVLDISCNKLKEFGYKKLFQRIANLSKLTKLKFCGNLLTHLAADDVAAVLLHNSKLKEIDFSNNNLQAAGAITIFNAMKDMFTLIYVNISHNWITSEAADYIAAVLSQNVYMKELYLANNYLEANGIISLCKGMSKFSYLTHLDMSCNKITDEAAHDIATLLFHNPELKVLDLSNNLIQTPGAIIIFKEIGTLAHLTKLNTGNNNITSEAAHDVAAVLSQNRSLKEFELNYNLKASDAVKLYLSIKKFTGFIKVDVGGIRMTNFVAHKDDIVDVLNNSIKLEQLDCKLDATSITNIVRTLNISRFIKLKVDGNNFTDLAADDIAAILLHNNKLEEIDLSDNNLLAAGAISIFNAMKDIFTLSYMNISHNGITSEAADDIVVVLSQNIYMRELYLASNYLKTNGITALCKGMNKLLHLTHLDMSCNKITDEAAHDIATLLLHNPGLKELDLSNNFIQASGAIIIFRVIHTLTQLSRLNICNNNITGEAAYTITAALSQKKYLKELELNYDLEASSAVKFYLIINNFTGLIRVDVGGIRMTDFVAYKIAGILMESMKLSQLDLSYNNLEFTFISKVFKRLNFSHLTKINISNNAIDKKAANIVGKFLSENRELKELDISCNNLYESGTKRVCKRITSLSKLTTLKISSNNFTHLAADHVAAVLLHNTELEEIDMSDNNLLAAGAITIFNAMKDTSTLSCINIRHNWITSEAADYIAAVLTQNVYMKELYLANNYLEANGIIVLCKGMSKFSYLTHLDMSCNEITDEAAHDIAALLFHNPELKELDLSSNLMQAPGATIILSTHSSLNKINICRNEITDEAADAIAKFLSQNTKLKEFDVSYNCLQANGAIKIFKAIKKSNLLKLNLSNNLISEDAADVIISVLSTNTKLIEVNLENNKMMSDTIHNLKECASKMEN